MQIRQLQKSRKLTLFAIGIGITVISAAATVFVLINRSAVNVPQSVSKSVDFKIVVPKRVPKDSSVASAPAYSVSEKVVTTSFKTSKGAAIVISQQKKPNIDLRQIDAKETYLAPVGSVYVLKGEAGYIQAIIESEDSWIMVSCDQSIGIVVCKSVISDLAARN